MNQVKWIALAMALVMMFSMASCSLGSSNTKEDDTTTVAPETTQPTVNGEEESTTVAVCEEHVFEGEGTLVRHEGDYAFRHVCEACGGDVFTDADVVSASDRLLYDESAHWTNVLCAVETGIKPYKVGNAAHVFDSNGVCKGCFYNTHDAEGLEYEEVYNDYGELEGYRVVGLGYCTDAHINVPAMYNDMPVLEIGPDAFNAVEIEDEDITIGEAEADTVAMASSSGYTVVVPGDLGEFDYAISIESAFAEIGTLPEEWLDEFETVIITIPDDGKEEAATTPAIDTGAPVEQPDTIIGISIPATVTTIDCTAFSNCGALANFLVDTANEVFKSVNNCLIDSASQTLVRGCAYSVIPADGSVTVIGSYAFAQAEGLVSITIPDSVQSIGDKAFFECEALVEVKMPESAELGVDVFRGSIHVEIEVTHELVLVEATAATCEAAGNIAHYVCTGCGNYYEDANGTVRLYNVAIPAAHTFVDGACSNCGMAQSEAVIYRVEEVASLGKFPLGTLESAIGLPQTVNAWTLDETMHQLPVVWDLSAYNKSVPGVYTLTGLIQAGAFHFADGMTNEIYTTIEIVEFMKGTADIIFVLDISGSMGGAINNVKDNIIEFTQAVEAQGIAARWAAVTFSDLTVSGDGEQSAIIYNGAEPWFGLSAAESYRDAIQAIELAYGGDGPETGLDGLLLANTIEARQDARVFYILLTDADCKLTNNYGVETMEEGAAILDANRVNVSVITNTSLFDHYSPLTSVTGGIQSNISGHFAQDLYDQLLPIILGEVLD